MNENFRKQIKLIEYNKSDRIKMIILIECNLFSCTHVKKLSNFVLQKQ